MGVHRDDSLQRFGCEGKIKNSEVAGWGAELREGFFLGEEDMGIPEVRKREKAHRKQGVFRKEKID